jgi:outer membrane protein assembly factor BamB
MWWIAAGLAAGITTPVATLDTWPVWRGDLAQTGRSPSTIGAGLRSKWRYTTGDAIVAGAVVDASTVYVGSKDGSVHAVDRSTGKMRWVVPTGGAVEAPGLLVNGWLIVGSRDGLLRALDAKSGREIWRFASGSELLGAPAFVPATSTRGPRLVVGDYGGDIHDVDLMTGVGGWTVSTGSYIYGSPAIIGDAAVLGGCDGFVYTIGTADGQVRAKVEVGAYVGASVAVEGTQGWVGHFGNRVLGFDWTTGATLWSHFDRSFPYLSSPALTDEIVILGGRDRVVRALHRSTGEVWWMAPVREKVDSSPVVVGKVAVVGSEDGRLYVLALDDGSVVQAVDLGAGIAASPAVASGVVYIGGNDGVLHALGSGGTR